MANFETIFWALNATGALVVTSKAAAPAPFVQREVPE